MSSDDLGNHRVALQKFLVDAFLQSDLQRMAAGYNVMQSAAGIVGQTLPLDHLVLQFINVLERHGAIEHEFFDILEQERPRKVSKIRPIRAAWGFPKRNEEAVVGTKPVEDPTAALPESPKPPAAVNLPANRVEVAERSADADPRLPAAVSGGDRATGSDPTNSAEIAAGSDNSAGRPPSAAPPRRLLNPRLALAIGIPAAIVAILIVMVIRQWFLPPAPTPVLPFRLSLSEVRVAAPIDANTSLNDVIDDLLLRKSQREFDLVVLAEAEAFKTEQVGAVFTLDPPPSAAFEVAGDIVVSPHPGTVANLLIDPVGTTKLRVKLVPNLRSTGIPAGHRLRLVVGIKFAEGAPMESADELEKSLKLWRIQ